MLLKWLIETNRMNQWINCCCIYSTSSINLLLCHFVTMRNILLQQQFFQKLLFRLLLFSIEERKYEKLKTYWISVAFFKWMLVVGKKLKLLMFENTFILCSCFGLDRLFISDDKMYSFGRIGIRHTCLLRKLWYHGFLCN